MGPPREHLPRGEAGEPLGEILDRRRTALGLSQARLADVLGISAPMLSQLMSAHRIKIGNPAAVHRLQVLLEAVEAVRRGDLDVDGALDRVAAVAPDVLTGTTRRSTPREQAAQVQAMFRRTAGAADYLDAAESLGPSHPEIADLLRVYGAGREDQAVEHFSRHC